MARCVCRLSPVYAGSRRSVEVRPIVDPPGSAIGRISRRAFASAKARARLSRGDRFWIVSGPISLLLVVRGSCRAGYDLVDHVTKHKQR